MPRKKKISTEKRKADRLIITGLRPISKKNNRVNFGYTSLPSKAFRRFEKQALEQLSDQNIRKLTGNISVDIVFEMKGKLDTDIDNMCSSIFDILEKAGCYENDKQIVKLTAKKIAGNKDWKIIMKLAKA